MFYQGLWFEILAIPINGTSFSIFYGNVLTIFGVLLLVEFSSITTYCHKRQLAMRKGGVKFTMQRGALSWLGRANSDFTVGSIVFPKAHDCRLYNSLWETTSAATWDIGNTKFSGVMHAWDQLMMHDIAVDLDGQEVVMVFHTCIDFFVAMSREIRTPMHTLLNVVGNSKSTVTCSATTHYVFWGHHFSSTSCLAILICCLVVHSLLY